MMRAIQMLIFLLLSCSLQAQDAYHSYLQDQLQNEYGLPAGSTWVLHDNEADNLSSAFSYGSLTVSDQAVSGQPFSQKVTVNVSAAGANPWDAAYGIQNVQPVGAGDAVLLVIWLRAEGGGNGQVSLFVENSSTYEKEVFLTFNPAAQWTPYFVPFEAEQNYAPGGLTTGLHLAWQQQVIEIGGLALVNYSNLVSVDDLPDETNNSQYGGFEADAPWRAEAADRIEQFRKAELFVRVEDAEGMPVQGATVEVEMLQHEYAFGSAVAASRFADNPLHSDIYESKLLDFDGEGHGFNCVVFENAMKWPAWESNWITTPPQTAAAVEWLREHDIQVRGHCLIWPGWNNLPNDMEANANNPDYLKQRVFDHIEAINTYPGIAGNIAEWDVLNEITTNRSLEMALQGTSGYATGREIYPEIFAKLQEVAPGIGAYVNDYVTISQANTGGGNYDLKKQFIQEIIDAGAKVDGIGFQGHIGAYPTSIYDVEAILDDFYNTFGVKAKITEYDTNAGMDDDLAATYLHDFLTMVFSHPSTDGFIVWGFWDGAHWHDNAPFFYQDWSMKPAAHTFIDLVYKDWWTEESGETDANGEYQLRGFKGKYRITIDCGNGKVQTDTVTLSDNLWIFKRDGELFTQVQEVDRSDFSVFPNPASDLLNIVRTDTRAASLRLFDAQGQLVFSDLMSTKTLSLPLALPAGVYEVVLEVDGQRTVRRVVIR